MFIESGMITRAIENAFRYARERGWERTYWAFDIHGTMIFPNYSEAEVPTEFYPCAREVLQAISRRHDIVRILFTCSHPEQIMKYQEYFRANEIYFDYVNENPEVPSNAYGCYEFKPYFNVLFEDKAGFDPHTDWQRVKEQLEIGEQPPAIGRRE